MDNQPRQSGFLLFSSLLALALAIPIFMLSCSLFAEGEKILRLIKAYYFLHENSRTIQFIFRNELKTGENWRAIPHGIQFCDIAHHTKQFFLATTPSCHHTALATSSLYYKLDQQPATPLIEQVEKIKILYGVDVNQQGYVQFYTEKPEAYDNQQIKIIQLFLLLSTGECRLKHPFKNTFFDPFPPQTDNRLYQVVHLVISTQQAPP